jgi:hypothetical protein
MRNYQRLEAEIISMFRNITADENNREIIKLLSLFQKYWKSYQDNWEGKYWEIYNLVYVEVNKRNQKNKRILRVNVKEEQFIDPKNKIIEMNDSILISQDEFKSGLEKEILSKKSEQFYIDNKFIFDENSFFSNKSNQKEENKYLSKIKNDNVTKDQTKSIVNLDDIDKELDGVLEKSIIDNKNERKNNCLDCNIL